MSVFAAIWSSKSGTAAQPYVVRANGTDRTDVTISTLIGKTILLLFTDGLVRNPDVAVGPVDYTFNSATGLITFASTVYTDQIITILYK